MDTVYCVYIYYEYCKDKVGYLNILIIFCIVLVSSYLNGVFCSDTDVLLRIYETKNTSKIFIQRAR